MPATEADKAGVVIIGSGLGGYSLAREIRKKSKDLPVTVLCADTGEVYSKPMLSSALTQGKTPDQLVTKSAAALAQELAITIHPNRRVTAIDRAGHLVTLTDGTTLPYGRLVLAVGADARPYSVSGSDKVPVVNVNDLDDYRRWRASLPDHGRILLIGAGLIGCEFANDLAGAGYHVSVVDPGPWPIARLLPQVAGDSLTAALSQIGVAMNLGTGIERLDGNDDGSATATLTDGRTIVFDRALSAIGLVPRTGIAEAAGLVCDRAGIRVDRLLATTDPDIFALGDCAATEAGPLPFVLPLMAEARALAATLTGTPTPLVLEALPVAVKTTCLPVVVCPPPAQAKGQWQVDGQGRDLKAVFAGEDGSPLGFALTGAEVKQRLTLAATMPPVLAK